MAREAKQEYRYHEDGAIALYRRPNSAMWYARCKLDDGVALMRGDFPSRVPYRAGHGTAQQWAVDIEIENGHQQANSQPST